MPVAEGFIQVANHQDTSDRTSSFVTKNDQFVLPGPEAIYTRLSSVVPKCNICTINHVI